MPYIDNRLRPELDTNKRPPQTPGELNYCLTKLIIGYCRRGLSYQHINDVLGAIEAAKMEFYRRVAVPYEDQKNIRNGDVYPPQGAT